MLCIYRSAEEIKHTEGRLKQADRTHITDWTVSLEPRFHKHLVSLEQSLYTVSCRYIMKWAVDRPQISFSECMSYYCNEDMLNYKFALKCFLHCTLLIVKNSKIYKVRWQNTTLIESIRLNGSFPTFRPTLALHLQNKNSIRFCCYGV